MKTKGWFVVSRLIKDDNGREMKDAKISFNFVVGESEN